MNRQSKKRYHMFRRQFLVMPAAAFPLIGGCNYFSRSEPRRCTEKCYDSYVNKSGDVEGGWGFIQKFLIESEEYTLLEILIEPASVLEYKIEVLEAVDMDFFVMTSEDFTKFEEGDDFSYITEASAPGVINREINTELAADTYYFVFDNTSRGQAGVEGEITVRFSFSARYIYRDIRNSR